MWLADKSGDDRYRLSDGSLGTRVLWGTQPELNFAVIMAQGISALTSALSNKFKMSISFCETPETCALVGAIPCRVYVRGSPN